MEPGTQHLDPSRHGYGASPSGEEVKEKASKLTQTARERVMSEFDRQKEHVSDLMERAAETVSGDRLGSYAADYARRGARYLRRTSAEEIYSSARSGLRSHPGVLLSACFVTGLAIARVMRRDDGAWGGRSDRDERRRSGDRSGRTGWPESRHLGRELGEGQP